MRYLAISLVLVVVFSGFVEAGQQLQLKEGKRFPIVDDPSGRVFRFYYKPSSNASWARKIFSPRKAFFSVHASWEGADLRGGGYKCPKRAPLVFGDIFGKLSPNGPWLYMGDVGETASHVGKLTDAPGIGALVYRVDVTCYTASCAKRGGGSVSVRLEEGDSTGYREKLYRLSLRFLPREEISEPEVFRGSSLEEDLLPPQKRDGFTGDRLGSFLQAKEFFRILHRIRQVGFIARSASYFPEARKSAARLLRKVGKAENQILSLPLSNYLHQSRAGKFPPKKISLQVRKFWEEFQEEIGPLSHDLEKLYYRKILKQRIKSDQELERILEGVLSASSRASRENRAKTLLMGIPPVEANE